MESHPACEKASPQKAKRVHFQAQMPLFLSVSLSLFLSFSLPLFLSFSLSLFLSFFLREPVSGICSEPERREEHLDIIEVVSWKDETRQMHYNAYGHYGEDSLPSKRR